VEDWKMKLYLLLSIHFYCCRFSRFSRF